VPADHSSSKSVSSHPRVRVVGYLAGREPDFLHGISDWILPQQVDAMKRTIDWFDQYLKGETHTITK
jgi:hypothetical protein